MSCRLIPRSSLCDIESVSQFLFDDNEDFKGQQAEKSKSKQSTPGRSSSMLIDCIISLSPVEDLFVLAKGKNAVFLTRKFSSKTKDDVNQWNETCWKGNLSQIEDESISAMLCVPLASQQRSSQGIPDCSCVIVGFTSGYVRIYLQTGIQLLSQFLHDGPVTGLDLKTKMPVKDNYNADQGEELIILYANAIVVIDGFSLFMVLKACRSQIAKAQASKAHDPIQPPPLAYRKWRLIGQEKVFDIVNCGMTTSTTFDRLVATSLATESRSGATNSLSGTRKFITSGANPFIGWYELKEEKTAPLMSEVAMNVASKLTTAVISSISSATSDWLGLGIASRFRAQPAKEAKPAKPPVEAGAPMRLRYGLPDKRRHAESIVRSPDGTLAACTDDFGRILIISNESGLVVRMLKGYRDAQCGWIVVDDHSDEQVNDDQDENKVRQALFLVIYAPRRGILEIWLAEQGNRVGAFNVGKDCRLIYNSHGTLGSRSSSTGIFTSPMVTCFLLEGDGNLLSINVPFHCSLSLLHSLRARDSFLLRKVSGLLEKGFSAQKKDDHTSTLKQLLQEIEAPDTLFQALQRISTTHKLSSTEMIECMTAIKEILDQRAEQIGDGDDLEYQAEIKGILLLCSTQLELISLFDSLMELHEKIVDTDHAELSHEALLSTLELTSEDSQSFLNTLKNFKDTLENQMPKSQTDLNIAEFLDCFTYDESGNSNQSEIPREPVTMFMKLSDDNSYVEKLANFYFKPYLENSQPLNELDLLIKSPYFDPEICMCLLFMFCQARECITPAELKVIHGIMEKFVNDGVSNIEIGGSKSIVQFWNPARSILEQSTSTRNALLVAFLCKSISVRLNSAQISGQNEETDLDMKWNDIDTDIQEWCNIIEKLEDLFILASFLREGHYDEDSASKHHGPKLSIKDLSNAGKGGITQIVAAQIVKCRIPGPCIANVSPIEETSGLKKSDNKVEAKSENSEILQALKNLQNRFPYSLERDALLAHCCWECILQWKMDVEDVSVLSSAVVHLSTISSIILKQGLAFLFWKAVFRDSFKNTYNLIEKIGKSPKDRLCRKHIGMSINALEKYLFTACSLLRQIIQADDDDSSNIEFPEFQVEKRWEIYSRSNSSIIESALDEPKCDIASLKNMWNVATSIRFTVFSGMKSATISKLFHPEEIRASIYMFPASCKLPEEFDKTLQNQQTKFCLMALSLIVEKFSATEEDGTQSDLMSTSSSIFELGNNWKVDDDLLWQNFTYNLFSAGLDSAGYEAMLSVHQKEDLVEPLLDICGSRLANNLINTDESSTLSKVISSLPTHITSWLQMRSNGSASRKALTVKENIKLLNRIVSFKSDRSEFIKDLIECLEIFVSG